jgi:hypothetical protein
MDVTVAINIKKGYAVCSCFTSFEIVKLSNTACPYLMDRTAVPSLSLVVNTGMGLKGRARSRAASINIISKRDISISCLSITYI